MRIIETIRSWIAHELMMLASDITPADMHGVKGRWSWSKEPQSFDGAIVVKLHNADSWQPDMSDEKWKGRVAFIFGECLSSGGPCSWGHWEKDHIPKSEAPTVGVSTWIELPVPIWELSKDPQNG